MRVGLRVMCVLSLCLLGLAMLKPESRAEQKPPLRVTARVSEGSQTVQRPQPTQPSKPAEVRQKVVYDDANPFAPKNWYVAPPPPPPPSPTPVTAELPQAAPPFPFRLAGVLEADPKQLVYYLTDGKQEFSVMVGETFGSQYRLDAADEQRLVFTYLPLQLTQTLLISNND